MSFCFCRFWEQFSHLSLWRWGMLKFIRRSAAIFHFKTDSEKKSLAFCKDNLRLVGLYRWRTPLCTSLKCLHCGTARLNRNAYLLVYIVCCVCALRLHLINISPFWLRRIQFLAIRRRPLAFEYLHQTISNEFSSSLCVSSLFSLLPPATAFSLPLFVLAATLGY